MDAEDQQEYASTDDEEEEDEEGAEPPLDQLVHSKEMLKKVLIGVPTVKKMLEHPEMRNKLIGCLMICAIGKEKVYNM